MVMQVAVHMDVHEVVRLQKFLVGQDLLRCTAADDDRLTSEHMDHVGDFFHDVQIMRGDDTTVFPASCACWSTAMMSRVVCGSSPAVGSSRRRTSGSMISTEAMATFFFSPMA